MSEGGLVITDKQVAEELKIRSKKVYSTWVDYIIPDELWDAAWELSEKQRQFENYDRAMKGLP